MEIDMDTLGGIIDKLFTVDMKMWNNQEILYKIRRMTLMNIKKNISQVKRVHKNCGNLYKKFVT